MNWGVTKKYLSSAFFSSIQSLLLSGPATLNYRYGIQLSGWPVTPTYQTVMADRCTVFEVPVPILLEMASLMVPFGIKKAIVLTRAKEVARMHLLRLTGRSGLVPVHVTEALWGCRPR
ncbi:MAG: hypothetical protein ACOYOB_20095 [Myxococcota bacterium]